MSDASPPVPEGPGSVAGAPDLPAGFTDTFTSRFVDTGEVRLHAVVGGEGPPLLLVHGWPESWYAWRALMPALAEDFEVVAVDQRGMGLSDKPPDGYDTATQSDDLVALMDALGHERFAVVGHDTGFAISYALAADHPRRVARVAFAEIPGSWHPGLLPLADATNDHYARLLSDPDAVRGSLGWYRALDTTIAQDQHRRDTPLAMPVLAIGGEASFGEHVAEAVRAVADDVQSVVIPGAGHFVAEEAPDALLAALTAFLAPYRRAADRAPATTASSD
jgi:pimeloyl-ACP methyl ester carboxylesterase